LNLEFANNLYFQSTVNNSYLVTTRSSKASSFLIQFYIHFVCCTNKYFSFNEYV